MEMMFIIKYVFVCFCLLKIKDWVIGILSFFLWLNLIENLVVVKCELECKVYFSSCKNIVIICMKIVLWSEYKRDIVVRNKWYGNFLMFLRKGLIFVNVIEFRKFIKIEVIN